MSKIRLLPVDSAIFKAVGRWCKWHDKTPTEAIEILFDVEDSTQRDDLMRAYYNILKDMYKAKQLGVKRNNEQDKTRWTI